MCGDGMVGCGKAGALHAPALCEADAEGGGVVRLGVLFW